MSLTDLILREVAKTLQMRDITAKELLDEYLKIALKGSCITFCNETAFENAKKLDRKRLTTPNLPPLAGLPFSLKDNINTKGLLTTCNSRSMKTNIPSSNALITQVFLNEDCILAAKNCMREFSVGKMEDSAYELRNYLVWAGTNKNINIGAFAVGTDIGLCETFCGIWIFKPAGQNNKRTLTYGVVTGAPSLEGITLLTRRADDLRFVYKNAARMQYDGTEYLSPNINANDYKILVYDNANMADFLIKMLEGAGFCVYNSKCLFLDKAEIIFDVVLSTEFYTELQEIGIPTGIDVSDVFYKEEYLKNRIEGIGFEAKRHILTGAHLLNAKNKEKTQAIIDKGTLLKHELEAQLETYDFVAAPVTYDDNMSKASAIAGLAELTVPFGDVLPYKLYTTEDKQELLLDIAVYLEDAANGNL